MTELFYVNLPDSEKYEIVRNHAFYNFIELHKFLVNAKKSLEKQIHNLS